MKNIDFIQFINSNIEKYTKDQNHKMLIAFRNIKSEYIYEKEKSKTDDSEIIKKMFNKRNETSNIYRTTNQELFEDECREMAILNPFLPPVLEETAVLEFLKTLDIPKEKKNFKMFQEKCIEHFKQRVDSAIILKYLNS